MKAGSGQHPAVNVSDEGWALASSSAAKEWLVGIGLQLRHHVLRCPTSLEGKYPQPLANQIAPDPCQTWHPRVLPAIASDLGASPFEWRFCVSRLIFASGFPTKAAPSLDRECANEMTFLSRFGRCVMRRGSWFISNV